MSAGSKPIYSEYHDDEDMAEIVVEFIDDLQERIAEIEAMVQSGDGETLASLAHQIKGAAGGYGFPDLTDLAREVEDQLRAEPSQIPDQAIDNMLSMCRRCSVGSPE